MIKTVSNVAHREGHVLYTTEDVRRVNEYRVKCCKESHSIVHCKTAIRVSYSAESLNSAWKKVNK